MYICRIFISLLKLNFLLLIFSRMTTREMEIMLTNFMWLERRASPTRLTTSGDAIMLVDVLYLTDSFKKKNHFINLKGL